MPATYRALLPGILLDGGSAGLVLALVALLANTSRRQCSHAQSPWWNTYLAPFPRRAEEFLLHLDGSAFVGAPSLDVNKC